MIANWDLLSTDRAGAGGEVVVDVCAWVGVLPEGRPDELIAAILAGSKRSNVRGTEIIRKDIMSQNHECYVEG